MTDESPKLDELEKIAECESKNFEVSRKVLGATAGIIDDLLELYTRLTKFAKLPSDETEGTAVRCILHLLIRSRSHLAQGALSLFRAYKGNALSFLRGAIEACTFASKIRKHPHMAGVWLNAVKSPAEYLKFRNTFKKLFPGDDPLLKDLEERYNHCSQILHSSVYSIAGHVSYDSSDISETISFNYFDLPGDHSIISALYFTVDGHKRILRKFGEILDGTMTREDARAWAALLESLEAKIDSHREVWKRFVPDPRAVRRQ